MVKYLHYLLAGCHLLNKTVQFSQILLLKIKVIFALFSTIANVGKHQNIADKYNQGQTPVQHKNQREGSHNLNKALDNHGKAVIKGVGDGIHIVGKAAHNIAVGSGVKVFQGQGLNMVKQIPPDFINDFLGRHHHGLGVAVGCGHAAQIDHSCKRHCPEQAFHVSRHNVLIDNRLQHVGSHKSSRSADRD